MKTHVKYVMSVMTKMNIRKLGSGVTMKIVVGGSTIGMLAFDGCPVLEKSSFTSSIDY